MLFELEMKILELISKLRNPLLDVLMKVITTLGDNAIFWLVLSFLLIIFKKYRRIGLISLLALFIGAMFTNVLLKELVGRARPFTYLEDYILLIKTPSDFSFPSGHTTASFASGGVLMVYLKKYRYLILTLAILIAFSRLYLYVHFPSDILGGILIGLFASFLAIKVVTFIEKRLVKRKSLNN